MAMLNNQRVSSGWLVVWNMTFIKNPFHIWNVILPIEELHHFSRWFSNHQPAGILCIVYTMNLILPWINRIQLMTCVGIGFHGKFYPFFWLRSIFQRCSIVAFTQLNLGIWPVGPVAPPQVKLPSQGRSVFAISLQKLTICGRFVDSMLGSSEISHEHIPHGWYKINHLMYPMKYHHQMVNYWAMWLTRPRRESLQAGKAQRLAKINGQTQRKGTPTDR